MIRTLAASALLSLAVAGAAGEAIPAVAASHQASDPVALTHSDVRTVQEVLNLYGFGAGPEDGHLGPKTRAALRRFQGQMGLPATGEVTAETWKLIREAP